MNEPDFYNNTPYAAMPVPLIDRHGRECRVVIVKATLTSGPIPRLADEQRPLRPGDEMWGAPEIADIRYSGDFCCEKPGSDVVVAAHVEGDERQTFADVEIQIAGRRKALRIHGERVWEESFAGVRVGPPKRLKKTPLAWSLAYGGFDLSDPEHPVEESRNPVGRGVARNRRDLMGKPAPCIEDPRHPINSPGIHNVPAGCAPIGRHYEPRRTRSGTYDSRWLEEQFPARPDDYDERHENSAPPDFVFAEPLRGGEAGFVAGLRPGGRLDFSIPPIRIVISATISGSEEVRRPHLDTVLVDADSGVIECVWRAAFVCPPKMRDHFTKILIIEKRLL